MCSENIGLESADLDFGPLISDQDQDIASVIRSENPSCLSITDMGNETLLNWSFSPKLLPSSALFCQLLNLTYSTLHNDIMHLYPLVILSLTRLKSTSVNASVQERCCNLEQFDSADEVRVVGVGEKGGQQVLQGTQENIGSVWGSFLALHLDKRQEHNSAAPGLDASSK